MSTRRPRPVAAARQGYPRLHPGWRALVGAAPLILAAPALADASLPAPRTPRPARAAPRDGQRAEPPKPVTEPSRQWLLDDDPIRTQSPPADPARARAAHPLDVVIVVGGVMARPAAPPPPRLIIGRARVEVPRGDPSAAGAAQFIDETLDLADGDVAPPPVEVRRALDPPKTK